jgi:hypothetical protein
MLPDAPVPDGRAVLPGSDAVGVEAVIGHGGHLPPFIRDTNPLERVNRAIGRRADIVGIFPKEQAAIRLAGDSSSSKTTNGSSGAATYRSSRSLRSLRSSRTTAPKRTRRHESSSRPEMPRITRESPLHHLSRLDLSR